MSYYVIDFKTDSSDWAVSRRHIMAFTEKGALECLHSVVKEQGRKVVEIYKVYKLS